MNQILSGLSSGSARRLIATVVGVAVLALNKKFGLEISELDKELLVGVLVTYIGQSAWKEQALAKVQASGEEAETRVPTPEDAKAHLEALKKYAIEEKERQGK